MYLRLVVVCLVFVFCGCAGPQKREGSLAYRVRVGMLGCMSGVALVDSIQSEKECESFQSGDPPLIEGNIRLLPGSPMSMKLHIQRPGADEPRLAGCTRALIKAFAFKWRDAYESSKIVTGLASMPLDSSEVIDLVLTKQGPEQYRLTLASHGEGVTAMRVSTRGEDKLRCFEDL